MTKQFNAAYFQKWYRDPRHKVRSRSALRRKAAMVLGIAEYILGRNVRNAIDIGCGEGEWSVVLRQLRPGIRYEGIDSSTYAIRRFGRTRNLRLGSLSDLNGNENDGTWDLVICSDVLHYVDAAPFRQTLRALAEMTRGVAFLDVMTAEDDPSGDVEGFYRRSASWYRKEFSAAGFRHCGMQTYVGPARAEILSSLER